MPRRTRKRTVFLPPRKRGWRSNDRHQTDIVTLSFDEYEAIKLLDYDNMKQEEVAAIINVSRPTLTRIYNVARQKVAKALVMGAHIEIKGGNVAVHESWHFCSRCNISFNIYDDVVSCPFCKDNEVEQISREFE